VFIWQGIQPVQTKQVMVTALERVEGYFEVEDDLLLNGQPGA